MPKRANPQASLTILFPALFMDFPLKWWIVILFYNNCWKMIIDEVVWNVIKNKHCSFRMKYFCSYIELSLRISAKMSTILLVSATEDHAHLPIPNMPQLDNKKESATSIWRLQSERISPTNSGKRWGSTSLTPKHWRKSTSISYIGHPLSFINASRDLLN